jgi:hypothetical protein
MTRLMRGVGNLPFYQIIRPHNTEGHYIHIYFRVVAVSTSALRSVNCCTLIPQFFIEPWYRLPRYPAPRNVTAVFASHCW